MKTKDEVREEALVALQELQRGGVCVSGGVGKSMIGICHAENFLKKKSNARFLVVAPSISIFTSWKEDIIKFGKQHVTRHITFVTYLSLTKQDLDYDVVYFDEMDSLLFSHEPWLQEYKGATVGLTATKPKTKNSERYKMIERYCPIIYEYATDSAVEDGILNDYRIIVHVISMDTMMNIEKTSKAGKRWMTSELKDYTYWTQQINSCYDQGSSKKLRILRMKVMQGFKSKERACLQVLAKSQNKCLVFANSKVQADRLSPHAYYSGNYRSENNLVMFKSGEVTRLACVQQLNRGINIPNLREIHILHTFSNERQFAQRLLRGLRLTPEETCEIHCYVFRDSVDMKWAEQALESFDKTKITWQDLTEELTIPIAQ